MTLEQSWKVSVILEFASTSACWGVYLPSSDPTAVKNLKAYVYYPMIGTTSISALVVWTGLTQSEAHGLVSSYTVILARENVEVTQILIKFMYSM